MLPNMVSTTLEALAQCLCEAIASNDLPDLCFCGMLPGETVIADYAGDCEDSNGMAWVRLTNLYPSVQLGAQNTQPGNCASMLGIDAEIGVFRTFPVGTQDGEPPTPAQMLYASELAIADAMAMRQAIYCCDALPGVDLMVGNYTPVGPVGGVYGGLWTIALQVP